MVLALLSFPLLAWAGAVSRTPAGAILSTLIILFFYSLIYGLWGLIALAWSDRRVEGRKVFVRFLFVCAVFISGLLYLPINPVAMLLVHLGSLDLETTLTLGRWKWQASTIHGVFLFSLLGSSLLLYRWTLRRLKEEF